MDWVLAFSLLLFFSAVLFGSFVVMGKVTYFQRKGEEDRYSWWGPAIAMLAWTVNAILLAAIFESWLARISIFFLLVGTALGNEVFQYKSFVKQREVVKETKW